WPRRAQMKSQNKRTPAKKRKQPEMDTMNTTTQGGSDSDDLLIISGSSDTTIDLGDLTSSYTIGNLDTITLDSPYINSGPVGTAIDWSTSDYGIYSVNHSPNVNITGDGIDMKPETDIKIGERSLKDFMDKVEDQLAILRPAPELEEKWDKLKELRRQYEECKQDILEKEKIMKILKED
ncbi:MAG: hypothetical protein ACO4CS_20755, partial [bacterium]